jgi:hypothetical protein
MSKHFVYGAHYLFDFSAYFEQPLHTICCEWYDKICGEPHGWTPLIHLWFCANYGFINSQPQIIES